jgi:hypothetical protein
LTERSGLEVGCDEEGCNYATGAKLLLESSFVLGVVCTRLAQRFLYLLLYHSFRNAVCGRKICF